jgi:hypothetical protein
MCELFCTIEGMGTTYMRGKNKFCNLRSLSTLRRFFMVEGRGKTWEYGIHGSLVSTRGKWDARDGCATLIMRPWVVMRPKT